MAEGSVGTIIYAVSATRGQATSFPGADTVRVGPNRYFPAVKVLLDYRMGEPQVVAIPIFVQEVKSTDDIESVRAALYRKVDEVVNQLLDAEVKA